MATDQLASALNGQGFSAMANGYHIRLGSGAIVTFGSPQAIRESPEVHWPAGRYDVHEGSASGLPHGRVPRRWGVAVKSPDGAVSMTPDSRSD
jgi:hypothetical protein